MDDGSEWTPKNRKTETEVNEKQVKIDEAQDQRTWRMKTRCANPKKAEKAEEVTLWPNKPEQR